MPAVPEVTRIALKNILFPTDFSPTSSAALPFAQALAHIYGATILVTHILPSEPLLEVVTDRLPAQDDRPMEDANQKLAELTRNPAFNGIRCKAFLGRGDLGTVIPAVIQEHDVDLVVLGTHGRRGVSKLVLGSNAEKIYRSATCPVLTVGPRAGAPQGSADWKLRHILCPIDVSEDPEPVLHYALSLAEENEAEIVIMEAIPMVPREHRAEVEERALRGLQSLIPLHAKDWCTPEFAIRWDHPAEAILRAAEEHPADLIVMSVHKARVSALSSHLPWPVASEVVSRAACPVLTLRV